MKAEQLHESIRPATVIVIGLTLAIAFGSMVGKGEPKLVYSFFAAIVAVALLLAVRQRIWMVIPVVWMLSGRVSVLPLPFTVNQLGVLLAFATCLGLKALKVVRYKPKFGTVDLWMVIVIVYVATVFIRNPVGMEALGSDRVGGRPYFDAIVACLAYWVLARSVVSPKESFFVPLLSVAGNGFHAAINFIADRFPSTIGPLANLYSGILAAENGEWTPSSIAEGSRLAYLQGLGTTMVATACSFWRPFTVINPLYFGRFVFFMCGVIAVLLSGFRSNLFDAALFFLVSSYYRRGTVEVLRLSAIGVGLLCVLAVMQGSIIQLPYAAQRSLSFLPGKWDPAAKIEAEESTEWRVVMWKAMLFEDKYIENKWLGDGFGFTKRQLDIMQANQETGTTADQQENLLISGGVHSGPVTTIRFVGYVGLVLFLILLVMAAIRASHLIRRASGTPYFTMAIFIGVNAVIYPITFVLIFGSFDYDLPKAIFTVGMLKLLENSLDTYAAEGDGKKPEREAIQPPKARVPRQFAPVGRT